MSYDEPFFHIPVKEDFKVNMSSNCSDGEWEVDGWGYGLSVSTGIYAKAEAKIRFLGRTWQTEARAEAGVRLKKIPVLNLQKLEAQRFWRHQPYTRKPLPTITLQGHIMAVYS